MWKSDSLLKADRALMGDALEEGSQFREIQPPIHTQLASRTPRWDAHHVDHVDRGKLAEEHRNGENHRRGDRWGDGGEHSMEVVRQH